MAASTSTARGLISRAPRLREVAESLVERGLGTNAKRLPPPARMLLAQPLPNPCPVGRIPDATGMDAFTTAYRASKAWHPQLSGHRS